MTETCINQFRNYLRSEEKAEATISKYLHDVKEMLVFIEKTDLNKDSLRFLYKGIIIKHNKTEPTYTKTSLFLCEKRRFFMARTEKGVVTTI